MDKALSRSEVERVELEQFFETARQTAAHRQEHASTSIRTAVLANGGALVGLYTVLGHALDKGIALSRFALGLSSVSLLVGLVMAGGAQFALARSWELYAKVHFDVANDRLNLHLKRGASVDTEPSRLEARHLRERAEIAVLASLALFGAGSIVALYAVSAAIPSHPANVRAKTSPTVNYLPIS